MHSTKSAAGGADQLLHGTTQRMLRCMSEDLILGLKTSEKTRQRQIIAPRRKETTKKGTKNTTEIQRRGGQQRGTRELTHISKNKAVLVHSLKLTCC